VQTHEFIADKSVAFLRFVEDILDLISEPIIE
jgi:hypothetical protein